MALPAFSTGLKTLMNAITSYPLAVTSLWTLLDQGAWWQPEVCIQQGIHNTVPYFRHIPRCWKTHLASWVSRVIPPPEKVTSE
jgi:hypothetical protein